MDPPLAVVRHDVDCLEGSSVPPQPANRRLAVDQLVPWPFRKFPYLYWIAGFIFFSFGAVFFAWNLYDWEVYLRFCLLYAIGLLTIPFVFKFSDWQFNEWAKGVPHFAISPSEPTQDSGSSIREWLEREMRFLRWSPGMWIMGVAVAIVGLLTYLIGDYPVGVADGASLFASLTLVVSAFVAGMGLYGVFGGCRLIWRLGAFHIRVEDHKFGVSSTGRMLLSCYFVIAVAWSVYCLTAVFGLKYFTSGMSVGQLYHAVKLPLFILVVPTLVGMLGAFVVCQVPMHRRMVEYKRDELERLENILQDLYPRTADGLTKDIKDGIEFFENRKAKIISLPEWPFGFKGLLVAIGSTVTVILPALVSSFFAVVAKASGLLPHGDPICDPECHPGATALNLARLD